MDRCLCDECECTDVECEECRLWVAVEESTTVEGSTLCLECASVEGLE